MSGELNRCPVTFTVNQEYSGQDVRFVDVYIDVMHTGDNLNFTSFIFTAFMMFITIRTAQIARRSNLERNITRQMKNIVFFSSCRVSI